MLSRSGVSSLNGKDKFFIAPLVGVILESAMLSGSYYNGITKSDYDLPPQRIGVGFVRSCVP